MDEILVTPEWLMDHLDDPDLIIIDGTNFSEWSEEAQRYVTVSGRDHWAEEHIPGSRHADFTAPGFTGDASRYRNTLPEPQAFADAMARLGVSPGKRVVLYDDHAAQYASRLWLMLRWIGFDDAMVLDGGWPSWEEAGGPTTDALPEIEPGKLRARPRPGMFIDKAAMLAAQREGALLIDALSPGQFAGTEEEQGISGHVSGAVNVPGVSLVSHLDDRFLSLDALAERLPWPRERRAIVYCASGMKASPVMLSMLRLGFADVSMYLPGLQEWIEDPALPMENRRAG